MKTTTDLRNYTISKATLRNEDLITSCMHFLWENDKETARGIWKENPNLLKALCDRECGIATDWWETDEANFLLNETIYDAMDALSPDGYYFGSHPGDGALFGYWSCDLL